MAFLEMHDATKYDGIAPMLTIRKSLLALLERDFSISVKAEISNAIDSVDGAIESCVVGESEDA